MRNCSIILFLFIMGCAVSKPHAKIENNNNEAIEIVVKDADPNKLLFEMRNNTDSIIYIFNPQNIHIEKFVDLAWEKIRIMPFPCGAPPARPREFVEIPALQDYKISWNKKESWCGKRNEKGFQETVKVKAESGKYRIRVIIALNNRKKEVLYKEFTLK